MRKTRYYVKNERPKLPVLGTAVVYLLLDKFNSPEWVWGAIGILLLIAWIVAIALIYKMDGIDIFDDEDLKKLEPKTSKSFSERLKEMADKRK